MSDKKKSPFLMIAVVAVLAIVTGGLYLLQGSGSTETAANAADGSSAEAQQPAGEERPDLFLGEADAPVELIEYASFTCPHCARFHQDVYPKLKSEYIDQGKVKFVLREVYFDQFGLAAGLLARCGGDIRYFGMVDLLFEKQSEWISGEGEQIVQNLYRIGRQAGLENDQMQICLQDKDLSTALIEDYRLKAGRDDVRATPSFVLNGEKLANSSWDELKSKIDAQLN